MHLELPRPLVSLPDQVAPPEVEGMVLQAWWDARAENYADPNLTQPTKGGPVGGVSDLTLHGRHGRQNNLPRCPNLSSINGEPTWIFDGNDDHIITDSPGIWTILAPATIAIILQCSNAVPLVTERIYIGGRSINRLTNGRIQVGSSGSTPDTKYITDTDVHTLVATMNGADSKLSLDSSSVETLDSGSTTGGLGNGFIGSASTGASQFFAGRIGAILIWSGQGGDVQHTHNIIHNWLKLGWRIS